MRLQLSPNESPKTDPNFFKKLPYPLLGSFKFDGIRGATANNTVMSRTWKPIPSYQVQDEFSGIMGLDGELIEGNWRDFDVYNRSQSHIMSADKPGEISYHVFDCIDPAWLNKPYYMRREEAHRRIKGHANYHAVEHTEIENYDELIAFEEKQLELGAEGIMMQNPLAVYKQGRATMLQQIIYKLKRFEDDEGIVLYVEEGHNNNNVLETDERGYAKRSSSKDGKVGAGIAGTIIVLWHGIELRVAMGNFNHIERKWIWENRELVKGWILKFRYFVHGSKDKPRFPRAVGWRNKIDM